MNERIKELMEEAGIYENQYTAEKFAELIVRECAAQVDWILAEGGKTQGDMLKEHFGVEE